MGRFQSTMSARERFFLYVSPEPNSGCWLWMAACSRMGYGTFQAIQGKSQAAHRIAYTWMKGIIPKGMDLHHKCRVTSCVNPDHLEVLTRREHIAQHPQIGVDNMPATRAAIEHFKAIPNCKWGHPKSVYSKRNRDGTTYCAACRQMLNDRRSMLLSEKRRMARQAKIVVFGLE